MLVLVLPQFVACSCLVLLDWRPGGGRDGWEPGISEVKVIQHRQRQRQKIRASSLGDPRRYGGGKDMMGFIGSRD